MIKSCSYFANQIGNLKTSLLMQQNRLKSLLGFCVQCAQPIEPSSEMNTRYFICDHCQESLPFHTDACVRCAAPLPSNQSSKTCGRCLKSPPQIDGCLAAFTYQPPISHWITQAKFSQRPALLNWLGDQLAAQFTNQLSPLGFNALLAMPLHARRVRQRGYNQAELLARPLASALQLPVIKPLKRCINTQAQSTLTVNQRKRNVKNAFIAHHKVPKRVFLIDDVTTTGSTLNSAAKALKLGGAQQVIAIVAAYAPALQQ